MAIPVLICFTGDVEALEDTNRCLEKDVTSLKCSLRDMEAAQLIAVRAGKQLKKRSKHAECEAARFSDELEKMNHELAAAGTLRDQLQDEITLLQMQVYFCCMHVCLSVCLHVCM